MEDEIICTACGWIGTESALFHPPKIGWAVCPKCESPDDLINGEDLDNLDEVFMSEGWSGEDFVMMESLEDEVCPF